MINHNSEMNDVEHGICPNCNSDSLIVKDFCFDCGTQLCRNCGGIIKHAEKCEYCDTIPSSKFITYLKKIGAYDIDKNEELLKISCDFYSKNLKKIIFEKIVKVICVMLFYLLFLCIFSSLANQSFDENTWIVFIIIGVIYLVYECKKVTKKYSNEKIENKRVRFFSDKFLCEKGNLYLSEMVNKFGVAEYVDIFSCCEYKNIVSIQKIQSFKDKLLNQGKIIIVGFFNGENDSRGIEIGIIKDFKKICSELARVTGIL